MEFLSSDWFTWVVIFIVASSIFTIFYESFVKEQDLDWSIIWNYLKKIIGFILTMILLPVVIIIGLIDEKRREAKKKDSFS